MPACIPITETEDGWSLIDQNARPVIEEGNEQPETIKDLEPLLAHIDRGGCRLRRLKIGQEFVGVPDTFDVCDFGFLVRSGRFAIVLPDELEVKLRPLQGKRVAILRYSDNGYSVRLV